MGCGSGPANSAVRHPDAQLRAAHLALAALCTHLRHCCQPCKRTDGVYCIVHLHAVCQGQTVAKPVCFCRPGWDADPHRWFVIGGQSFSLALISTVCIAVSAIAMFKLKEVAPPGKAVVFWKVCSTCLLYCGKASAPSTAATELQCVRHRCSLCYILPGSAVCHIMPRASMQRCQTVSRKMSWSHAFNGLQEDLKNARAVGKKAEDDLMHNGMDRFIITRNKKGEAMDQNDRRANRAKASKKAQ